MDVSALNLDETARVVAERGGANFKACSFVKHPAEALTAVTEPVNVSSQAVFQHLPSQEHAADVLSALYEIMAPQATGVVQIRFDSENPKYRFNCFVTMCARISPPHHPSYPPSGTCRPTIACP